MKHLNVTFKPDNKQISIHHGATSLEAAGQAGIILNTPCGGKAICKKCIVNIGPDSKEVLACQNKIETDLIVTIPLTSRFFEQKILAAGVETKSKFEHDIYEKYLKSGDDEKIYGVAVDIGTTTIVAKLIDMKHGSHLATESELNPQTIHGDDVISRISFAQTDDKLNRLQNLIVECLNTLISRLCEQADIKSDLIYEICAVGNTTMNHIFLRFPIQQLGRIPFNAHSLDAQNRTPAELNLNINQSANIHTPPNIAGFVGSDTTAVTLAVDTDQEEGNTLIIDIGTNGELVLAAGDKLYAASCAAGPALEGARITCGSRATQGAIEAVVINENDIDIDVIGRCRPRSICGSGLIDAVAVLLNLGVIDSMGGLVETKKLAGKLSEKILERITEKDGQPAFCIYSGDDHNILLTQRDIRQVQLAKAAIRAGIKLLQNKTGIDDSKLDKIYLAGAFGNYIRKQSAIKIGLLPDVPPEKIHFVGNAASSGAQLMLISSNARQASKQLAKKIEYIEIANEPKFTDIYTDSMLF